MIEVFFRRVRLNFRQARFWIGFAVLFGLGAVALTVSVRDLLERRTLYEVGRDADEEQEHSDFINTYSQTQVSLHRRPEPLSALSQGLGERYGSAATLFGNYGSPRIFSRSQLNFLYPAAVDVDFLSIVMRVTTLLAMLLTADVISGERSRGTLQLLLSGSLPRSRYLAGEYLGSLFSLIAPLFLLFAVAALALALGGAAALTAPLLARLVLLLLLVSAGVSVFTLLGLWISSLCRDSGTALVAGLLTWTLVTTLYPEAVLWKVHEGTGLRTATAMQAETSVTRALSGSDQNDVQLPPGELRDFQRANTAQAQRIERWWRLSPYSSVLLGSQAVAGTDLAAHLRFLATVERLDRALADWQTAQVRRDPTREKAVDSGEGGLDLAGLPEGAVPERGLGEIVELVAPLAVVLLAWNFACSLGLHLSFGRYDVRAG